MARYDTDAPQEPGAAAISGSVRGRISLHRRMIAEEEERGELRVNIGRLALGLVGVILASIVRNELSADSFRLTTMLSTALAIYSAAAIVAMRVGFYPEAIKYVSVMVEVVLLTTLLWAVGGTKTFKSPVYVVYFVFLALAALRFSIRLTAFAGAVSVLANLALLVGGAATDHAVFGSLSASYVSAEVSATAAIVRIAMLAGVTFILVSVATGYHRIVRRSVLAELRAQRRDLDHRRVRDALSRYLSPQVADAVLKRGLNAVGERRHVTVLFLDIRDFTELAERLEPEEVVKLLNTYLARMAAIVFEHGGTLDKFIGDGLMAVFGAPLSGGRDEEMAVRASLEMRQAVGELNDARAPDVPIRIGIGIHSGEAVIGDIGSPQRRDYTAVGRTVNIASRVEELTKELAADILVTRDTLDRVVPGVNAKAVDPARLRGISATVPTFLVEGLDAAG